MDKRKLKYGGARPRRKALFGADGAVMAAATLAAAGISAGATAAAAKSQAKAVTDSAKVQAQSIKDQTLNNNNLQQQSINFTRQENQENRQQQQNIQTTLQMLAGQQNMNDRMEANKIQVRYGGKPKRPSLKSHSFYGGARELFDVTDGGGAIPVDIDQNGYGVYELYGNDHEHTHKTAGGNRKTGVGIKFSDGSVVEGEGNQNTNRGELLYITPTDAMFISKHDIDGFNPRDAVMLGADPEEVFMTQELLKLKKGLNDDGTKAKCGTRKSLKKTYGGMDIINNTANITQLPSNGTAPVAAGIVYNTTRPTTSPVGEMNYSNPVAKRGGRITLKNGGNYKYGWGDYAGATYNAAGNLLGAGITTWGNMYAGKRLGQAYSKAGDILADAYSQMKGIDMSEISREDFSAPHTLAVVRSANTNINPQLERLRRNADSESREINRGTLSSAARQQRLAATNDRMMQRMAEQYAYKDNADEQIKQTNAQRITKTAAANADRDVQANKDYTNQRLSLLQYNNNIENAKIAGMAQARADALTQAQTVNSQAFQNSMGAIGSALSASGQGFASAFDTSRKLQTEAAYSLLGMPDNKQIDYIISTEDALGAQSLFNRKQAALTDTSLAPETRKSIISDMTRLKSNFPSLKGVIPNN